MSAVRLRVIDIETSGGTPSEIIEIGAVDVVATNAGWMAEPPRSRLFRARGEMSFHAMAVHHLTPDVLAQHSPCDDESLSAFIVGDTPADYLVAHSAAFESAHIPPDVTGNLPWICTVKGAKAAWPEAPGHANQVLRYWRNLDLDPALAMPAHRAAPDAWVTAHLLIDLLKSATVETLHAWTTAPRDLSRIPFGKYRGQPWSAVPNGYLRWMSAEQDMAEDVVERARRELEGRMSEAA
jgi:exodeoxyribonuclease X